MAWWLGILETLYQKYGAVLFCWHALGVLSIVLGVVIWVAGGGLFFGMPTSVVEGFFYFLAVPWGLLAHVMALNYLLFGWNRSELSQVAVDEVVALLKVVGEPLHYREIHQKLGEPPVTRNGEHAMGLLLLFRNDPRIYRPRWATYGLVEWQESKRAADAVVALLKEVGEPLHYREIDQKLKDLGIQLAGEGAAQAIKLLVQQDPRLYRPHRDTYGLVKWRESKPAADADVRTADADVRTADADTVVALIKEAGQPLHYREIDQKLDDLGLRLAGGGAARAVTILVQQDPRLYLLHWDTCGLVEWRKSKPANAAGPPRKSESAPASRRREQLGQDSRRYAPLSGPLELAYEVLRAEGRPLHYAQLADRMLATGKWTTEAKSPSSTLNSYISKHISRHGDASPFFRASRGVYGLR